MVGSMFSHGDQACHLWKSVICGVMNVGRGGNGQLALDAEDVGPARRHQQQQQDGRLR
ncbi:MAG: hypothetical protein WDN06_01440 [Asticcacaulis sp.]